MLEIKTQDRDAAQRIRIQTEMIEEQHQLMLADFEWRSWSYTQIWLQRFPVSSKVESKGFS
jgi:hypothetical protein